MLGEPVSLLGFTFRTYRLCGKSDQVAEPLRPLLSVYRSNARSLETVTVITLAGNATGSRYLTPAATISWRRRA